MEVTRMHELQLNLQSSCFTQLWHLHCES